MKTCSKCSVEKPLTDFWTDRARGRAKSNCKECSAASVKAWRKSNPTYERDRYVNDKAGTRERHLIRKYGVSLSDYDQMLAAQSGCCAICGATEESQHNGVFHVDHCHSTGRVRGLLCRGCNHMLGVVGDDPAILYRAISYLSVPQVAAEVIAAYLDISTTPSPELPR